MLNFPLMWNSFPLNIYRFIKCNMVCATPFIYKNIFPQVVKFINPSRKLFFVAFLWIPNPSSMNLLNISGHVIFFRIHIIHSSSFNIAIYTYICEYWCKISSHHYSHYSHKNSSWNLMIAPFKTIFIISKIRSALGIMFWYLKISFSWVP